jgi:hypothetical protein
LVTSNVDILRLCSVAKLDKLATTNPCEVKNLTNNYKQHDQTSYFEETEKDYMGANAAINL